MATNPNNSLIGDAIAELGGGKSTADDTSAVESLETVNASDSMDDNDSELDEVDADTASEDSDTPAPAPTGSSSKSASGSKKTSDKETIVVSDEAGKRKVEIDYSDRTAIKKAFELAHGARKWQAERDKTLTAEKQLREKYTSDRRVLDALEQAYASKGELGVIDLIAGKAGASAEFIKRQVDRAKFLERASPEEVEQLQQKEELEQLKRDMAQHRSEQTAREKRIEAEREAAEIKSLESRVNPAFEKYRFDGLLGDSDDEALYDKVLWNQTMERLEPYEKEGIELSRELVDKTFKDVSAQLRKRMSGVAERKAAGMVARKKQEALEHVQADVTSGYKKGGARKEAEDLISKGDFKSLISNWGSKYGKAFK